MRSLNLKPFLSPGDIVMLTAAVRDLYAAHPGGILTDVRTSADALFDHNPHVTKLREGDRAVETIDMHYPLIHQSNQRPCHFLHGYVQFLEDRLDLTIPVTRLQGDIHLSEEERNAPPPGRDLVVPDRFWIVIAGGTKDFTAKWWIPASHQAVINHFQGTVAFVQCEDPNHICIRPMS